MSYKYIPHTQSDIDEMLKDIGATTVDDLYSDIPESMLFKGDYDLPESMSETEVRQFIGNLSHRNQVCSIFAGAGAYNHYAPSVVGHIIERSEFLTAYTPYQPEISQGTLQYIFEFQSMMSELTGMQCCNASMYDGPTAAAETMMMCVTASKKRNKVLVSATMPVHVMRVMRTYAHFHGIDLQEVAAVDGVSNLEAIKTAAAAGDVAGVIVAQPNRYGIIEDYTGLADALHSNKTLLGMYADPSALAVLKSPAEWGADIACGDGQTLGMPLSCGGPYVGYMATTKDLVRKMPGRIVGATHDVNGRRAFVLTLQAREQHIRREKANSNICSNQSLMALYATVYLSLMGRDGMKEVNASSYANAHYLHDELCKSNHFKPAYDKPFLKEFVLSTDLDIEKLQKHLLANGIFGAVKVAEGQVSFCATENNTKEEIEHLLNVIKSI
ncbi:MAG: aminomethyl-transferring glycine dehydrogenase subunit GcvPA [Muribaculaceae bacterium]